jgi:hypothetical protein
MRCSRSFSRNSCLISYSIGAVRYSDDEMMIKSLSTKMAINKIGKYWVVDYSK